MELKNEFDVAAPVEKAWPLLTDIEKIAPCVPGFKLTGSEDGEYRGTMKVKVGAVQTSYDCTIRFVNVDDANHRAEIAAQGRELRGQGGVTANIVSQLSPAGDKTHASITTNVDVTGRVAQFGRGILAEVSDRLVKQFVKQLETKILAPEAGEAAGGTNGQAPSGAPSPGPGPATQGATPGQSTGSSQATAAADEPETEPLDLLSVAGGPVAKRAAIAGAVLLVIGVLAAILRSRRD